MVQIAVFVGTRGRGSNLRAIHDACSRGEVPARVTLVVGTRPDSGAIEWAREAGLPTVVVEPGDGYGPRLLDALKQAGVEWICLAGYLRLLPAEVLQAFPNKVLNIHPALLPKHGGKGMYGMHVHEAVLAAGDEESGCTVHYVTERYDEGAPILQMRCPVLPGETPEALAARVIVLEHQAYPEALRRVLQ